MLTSTLGVMRNIVRDQHAYPVALVGSVLSEAEQSRELPDGWFGCPMLKRHALSQHSGPPDEDVPPRDSLNASALVQSYCT